MPPRLMSLFCSTATVLSPEGLGLAGSPAGSVSGVNDRPTPKPGSHVSSSAPPGTRSCFTGGRGPATATPWASTNTNNALETFDTTDKGHLRVSGLGDGKEHWSHRASTKDRK